MLGPLLFNIYISGVFLEKYIDCGTNFTYNTNLSIVVSKLEGSKNKLFNWFREIT